MIGNNISNDGRSEDKSAALQSKTCLGETPELSNLTFKINHAWVGVACHSINTHVNDCYLSINASCFLERNTITSAFLTRTMNRKMYFRSHSVDVSAFDRGQKKTKKMSGKSGGGGGEREHVAWETLMASFAVNIYLCQHLLRITSRDWKLEQCGKCNFNLIIRGYASGMQQSRSPVAGSHTASVTSVETSCHSSPALDTSQIFLIPSLCI